jgi:hypothetical protein
MTTDRHKEGMTDKEREVVDTIILAYTQFKELDNMDEDDLRVFQGRIDYLKQIVWQRSYRRDYPMGPGSD